MHNLTPPTPFPALSAHLRSPPCSTHSPPALKYKNQDLIHKCSSFLNEHLRKHYKAPCQYALLYEHFTRSSPFRRLQTSFRLAAKALCYNDSTGFHADLQCFDSANTASSNLLSLESLFQLNLPTYIA